MKPRNVISLVILVVVLIVIFQNSDTVETKLLFFSVKMPRFLLLLTTFLFGLVIGYLARRKQTKQKQPQA